MPDLEYMAGKTGRIPVLMGAFGLLSKRGLKRLVNNTTNWDKCSEENRGAKE